MEQYISQNFFGGAKNALTWQRGYEQQKRLGTPEVQQFRYKHNIDLLFQAQSFTILVALKTAALSVYVQITLFVDRLLTRAVESEVPSSDSGSFDYPTPTPTFSCISYLKW